MVLVDTRHSLVILRSNGKVCMELNNPAFRLHSLLYELKNHRNSGRATSAVLAEVIGVDPSPTAVIQALVGMHSLLDEVILTFRANPAISEAFLDKYVSQLRSAIEITNLDAGWDGYKGKISPECLTILDMIAHQKQESQDGQPSPEDIKELQERLQSLFESAENSKLDPEFRKFILEQVENLRRCLAEYRISGLQGFERYLETFFGQLVRHSKVVRKEAHSNSKVYSNLRLVLASVAKFVGLTHEGIKFLENVKEAYSDGARLLEYDSDSADGLLPEVGGNVTDAV